MLWFQSRPSNGNLADYHPKTSNNQEVQAWAYEGLNRGSSLLLLCVEYLPSNQDFLYQPLRACRDIEVRIGQLINPVRQAGFSLCIIPSRCERAIGRIGHSTKPPSESTLRK